MKHINTLADLEKVAPIVSEFKDLKYQIESVYPKMAGLSAYVPQHSALQSVYFSKEVTESITLIARNRLNTLVEQLKEYGIEV